MKRQNTGTVVSSLRGKGGGKPDNARGGGKDARKLGRGAGQRQSAARLNAIVF
jgi:hypothetical protein